MFFKTTFASFTKNYLCLFVFVTTLIGSTRKGKRKRKEKKRKEKKRKEKKRKEKKKLQVMS